jgi:hypothetical protein
MGARGSRSAAAAAGPRPAPAVVVLLAMDEKRKSCWSCDWISLWLNLRRRLLRGAGGGPRWSECVAIPRSVLQPSLGRASVSNSCRWSGGERATSCSCS